MSIDSTFWVAISFVLFFLGLIYLKVPQKINNLLNKMIIDIKNEIDESEKLRSEAKKLLDNSQNKLNQSKMEVSKILDEAKKDSEQLIIEMNDRFHKSAETKKKLAETKIIQMKENALKELKDVSVKIAIESVKKIVSTSIDKTKLDALFEKKSWRNKKGIKKK